MQGCWRCFVDVANRGSRTDLVFATHQPTIFRLAAWPFSCLENDQITGRVWTTVGTSNNLKAFRLEKVLSKQLELIAVQTAMGDRIFAEVKRWHLSTLQ
jgi:hypothetical protein